MTKPRAGSMKLYYNENKVDDIMSHYFNNPVWERKWGDPVPDMPLDVQLELVNVCNLSCVACCINKQTRVKSYLSWEILKRIVDEAADEGVCYFTICGIGEATLHPNLFDLLAYIRSKKVQPTKLRTLDIMPSVLISNAVWSKKQIDLCLESPPDLLSVSLAGLTDEEIRLRRDNLDVNKFYDTISHIYNNRKENKPVIHISTHIYPSEMGTKGEEQFIDKWLPICDAVVTKPTMIDQHHKELSNFLDVSTLENLKYTNISSNHFERTAPCMEVSRRLSINSDGSVWCGHHNSEDFGGFLGNVYKQSLREIWHSDKMNQFRKETRAGIFHRECCKNCGGEIRDFHRNPTKQLEKEIIFD